MEKIQDFSERETALLIDRYKFLGLLPCADNELRAIGYWDLVKHQLTTLPASSARAALLYTHDTDACHRRPQFPTPDTDQMLPFKPRAVVPTGSHPVAGGVFPPPPAASALMAMMPPPDCFHGPNVIIDKMMDYFKRMKLPEGPVAEENGKDGDFRLDLGTKMSIEIANGTRKRKVTETESDDEDGDHGTAAPINDIYRQRQQKKIIK